MICQQCGQEVPEGIKFCTNCGAAMIQQEVFEPLPEEPKKEEETAVVRARLQKEKPMAQRFLFGLVLCLCLHEVAMLFFQAVMNQFGQDYANLGEAIYHTARLLRLVVFLILGITAFAFGHAKSEKAGAVILLILSILTTGAYAAFMPQLLWLVEGQAKVVDLMPVLGTIIGLGSAFLIAFLIGVLGKPRKIWIYVIMILGCFILLGGFTFVWNWMPDLDTAVRSSGLVIGWLSADFFALLAMPAIGLSFGWIRKNKLDKMAEENS